ncbi:MAG: EAL domain-containing protein [Campylobacterales bacterium]|nr:EAL domain-containing protein [Campylobacterales bacterium]
MAYFLGAIEHQLDYLYFLSGLFYLLAGGIALLLQRRQQSALSWGWFALFAAAFSATPWFGLFGLVIGPSARTGFVELAAGLVALGAMAAFVRRPLPSALILYPGIALAAAVAGWRDPENLHHISVTFLILPALLLGSMAFGKLFRTTGHLFFLFLSLLLGGHALLEFWIVSSCLFGSFCTDTSVVMGDLVGILSGSILFGLLWNRYLRYWDDERLPAATPSQILWPLLILAIVLAAGWIVTQQLGDHRLSQLKSELLKRSQVAANSIDADLIRPLGGSEADLRTPAYEELKHHLIHIRVVSRFLYLFTFREGEVVFIADSEPEDSPDLSPPGQVYTEATPAFLKALRTGEPAVLDPETDRWGTWVSALIPLPLTLQDGSPVFFGADVDAGYWKREILQSRFAGITVIFLVAFLLLYSKANTLHIRRINARLNEEIGLFVGGPSFVMKWVNAPVLFRTLYASPNIDPLLGYPAREIVSGKIPFPSLIHPEERGTFETLLENLSSEPGRSGECELRLLGKEGEYRWFHAFILTKNHTYALSYHAYFTDTDAQKKSELAFHKLSERLLLHFKRAPFAIIEWDTEFRVLDWNPAAEKIFGYTRDEAVGEKASDLILPPHNLSETSRLMSDLVTCQGGEFSVNDNITKEGKIITCAWHNTRLLDDDGNVIGVASIAEDITEKREAEAKIKYLAYYDELTGLPNRTLFKDHLQLECHRSDRSHTLIAVIFLDLDFFKTINDTLGHDVGNALLRSVSEQLQKHFRNSDTVSRFGGDEFAILLPDIKKEEDVDHILQALLNRFTTPLGVSGHELHVTLSIGYTLYPLDGDDPELLLRNADISMYSAKEAGRNMVRRYHSGMAEAVSSQLEIHNGLVNALKQHEFVLYYQPQYDLHEERISGAEALIRWIHPQKGLISPAEFIAVAEKTGLIVPIGEWVFRTACMELKRLESLGYERFTMAVNLSSRQFREKNFSRTIHEIIDRSGVRPESIELELTESILIEDNTDILGTLQDFKTSGIRLSIDDFGTGYSSLSYLKLFPIDKVKIDQSFTKNAALNTDDLNLVRAVIAISSAFGFTTIAEGVETQTQLNMMHEEGCTEIQGYFIARPMPAQELETFLETFTPPTPTDV